MSEFVYDALLLLIGSVLTGTTTMVVALFRWQRAIDLKVEKLANNLMSMQDVYRSNSALLQELNNAMIQSIDRHEVNVAFREQQARTNERISESVHQLEILAEKAETNAQNREKHLGELVDWLKNIDKKLEAVQLRQTPRSK